jgi:hypothetical protein
MNVSSLYGLDIRRDEDVGLPRNRRIHALDLRRLLVHRDVEIQWTVHPASDDLPAVCHLGEGGGIHGRRHLRIHILDGGKNRDLGLEAREAKRYRMCQTKGRILRQHRQHRLQL